MTVASKNQFFNARIRGEDPANPAGPNVSDAFTGSGGSASGGAWVITNSTYSIGHATSMTMVAMLSYNTAPDSGAVLMTLDNGTKLVQVKSKGNNTQLDLVGATTVTINDLDLNLSEDNSVPLILRLTMDASGNAKLYTHEILRDTDGNDGFYSVAGASTSSATASFGNTSGSVNWFSIYYSKFGAFNPEELMLSDFAQDTLARMGISVIDTLKESNRPFIKKFVSDSSIVYGYDLSSQMINRIPTPSIHVMFQNISSPSFDALGGSQIEQLYTIGIFVTTKGTNYEDCYRLCLNIMGEVFDELYVNTGLRGTTDSLDSYNMNLDTKLDDDETVCVHELNLTYRRRIKMTRR
tara:strand:+ start:1230 stop:2285 length:1056 start_codon:yes stop_codon:yes gene_type:complete